VKTKKIYCVSLVQYCSFFFIFCDVEGSVYRNGVPVGRVVDDPPPRASGAPQRGGCAGQFVALDLQHQPREWRAATLPRPKVAQCATFGGLLLVNS
jgi:hypothetical protein